jgi:tetratricopeptide (TPR) repeat protein
MGATDDFAALLAAELRRTGYSPGQAALRAGLPKATVVNWLSGRVRKPRAWQDLLRLAAALGSDLAGVTQLLQAADYPSLAALQTHAAFDEQVLFAPWATRTTWDSPPPFQAIPAPAIFVGRAAELADLRARLLAPQQEAVYCLQGMAGVGKTTLAAQLAYLLAPYFPDGVLWARLDTADPLAVAGTFAAAYGRDVSAYPDLESRSRVLREVLAHKRVLLVLDNAESGAAVEPFLPPTGPCAVLITTRRQDLQVGARMHRVAVAPFAPDGPEARALFAHFLGADTVARQGALLDQIAGVQGHLPLALAIVAGRLATMPTPAADTLLARLREEQQRLPALVQDHWSVQLSFADSYRALPAPQQAAFAALGALAGSEFSLEAALAVIGGDPATGAEILHQLYNRSLIAAGHSPGRYRLHPLLRDFARAHLQDPAVPTHMVAFFLTFIAERANDYPALDGDWSNIRAALDLAPATSEARRFPAAVLALASYLEARGRYPLAAQLAEQALPLAAAPDQIRLLGMAGRVAERQGDTDRAAALLDAGLAQARAAGDTAALLALLIDRGAVARQQGRLTEAATYLHEAQALARPGTDTAREAVLLAQLGVLARQRGEYTQAAQYYQAGLQVARLGGHTATLSALLASLSALAGQRGDYAQAESYLQEGLGLATALGHQEQIITALTNLGLVACRRGDFAGALAHLQAALDRARAIGHQERICMLLINLTAVSADAGLDPVGPGYLAEGLRLARTLNQPWLLCAILEEQGEFKLRQSDLAAAEATFDEMETVARTHSLREYQAAALHGQAQVAVAQGRIAAARDLGEQSQALYAALDHPRQRTVAAWLATVPVVPSVLILPGSPDILAY